MAPSERAWGAVTKFKIRGCMHCPGRNTASDVKANSKRQLAPAYRQELRQPQLLRGGVLDSRLSNRHGEVAHTERESTGCLSKQWWKTCKEKANPDNRRSWR